MAQSNKYIKMLGAYVVLAAFLNAVEETHDVHAAQNVYRLFHMCTSISWIVNINWMCEPLEQNGDMKGLFILLIRGG